MSYAYKMNEYHKCNECNNESYAMVYPVNQMKASTYMCKKHFKLFQRRYSKFVKSFMMNGMIQHSVVSICKP